MFTQYLKAHDLETMGSAVDLTVWEMYSLLMDSKPDWCSLVGLGL